MDKTFKIKRFIASLAKTEVGENACNMYAFGHEHNAIRRNNLLLYLLQMSERQPNSLLVGEAPGYQGCRWTGISFCSEHILLNGIPQIGMFGRERGYRKTTEWEKTWKEPSATIVWGALSEVRNLPLIWASYPFHPFKDPKNPLTNRAPTKEELKIGEYFLKEIMDIFSITRIIAVGNKAELTLGNMGISVPKIRHPANGGATQFREGIRRHLN